MTRRESPLDRMLRETREQASAEERAADVSAIAWRAWIREAAMLAKTPEDCLDMAREIREGASHGFTLREGESHMPEKKPPPDVSDIIEAVGAEREKWRGRVRTWFMFLRVSSEVDDKKTKLQVISSMMAAMLPHTVESSEVNRDTIKIV